MESATAGKIPEKAHLLQKVRLFAGAAGEEGIHGANENKR